MLTCLHNRPGHYLLLIALSLVLFFPNLGGPSLWDLDEGRNGTCTDEMMKAGTWVIPTFNGQLRPDKPALLYWLQMTAYHAFGVNEFAARLPSALAALLSVLLTYELARAMFTPSTGVLAGLVAAGTPMVCAAARFANPDALLNLFIVLTLALFWAGWQRPRLWWFIALGAAEGGGMLAKGAVGVVLPVAIIAAFLLWQRRLRLLFDRRNLAGALAFLLVAAPWYVRVTVETKGAFARDFFLRQHLERFLNHAQPMENHGGGIWYYPLVIALGTVPWAIFLGPAVWYAWWSALREPSTGWWKWWRTVPSSTPDDRGTEAYRLLGCWVGLFLIFFTMSATKLPNYALPAVVPTAIIVARFLDRWRLGELRLPGWVLPTSLTCLILTGIGLSIGLLTAGGALPIDVMHGRPLTALQPWALLGLLLVLGSLAAAWCVRRGNHGGAIACIGGCGIVLLAAIGAGGVMVLESEKSARALVAEAGALQRERDIRVVSWQLDHLPSLNFYLQRNVEVCANAEDVQTYLRYPLPVYAFLPASAWEQLRPSLHVPCRELARRPDLYKHDDVVVVTNQ